MRDMAHSICLIKLYQITMRKNFDIFVSDYLKMSLSAELISIVYRFYKVELNSLGFGSSSSIKTSLTEENLNHLPQTADFIPSSSEHYF